MGKITYTKKTTIQKVKKIPSGYHKCPNCGGDGICKNKGRKKS